MLSRWQRRAWLGAAALLAAACGDDIAAPTPEPLPTPTRSLGQASSARVAFLATADGDTTLFFASPGAPSALPVARFSHRRDGNVRAVTAPGRLVFATAPVRAGRDRSFDGGLFRLDPLSGAVDLLCEDVVHASRPLVDRQGRLFVVRGWAGAQPTPSELRLDDLEVAEVDAAAGTTRTLHTFHGYMVALGGAHQGELILYRVGPGGADLLAIDAASGAERVLVPQLPPFARDFSIDETSGALVYRGRHESDSHRWVVDAVDLGSGQPSRLYEDDAFALAPHAWPGGGVSLNPGEAGLALLGSSDRLQAPFGPGVDWVRAVSDDGRWVALLHTVAGQLPLPYVIDRQSQAALRLPAAANARVEIAGFLTTGGKP